MNPIHSWGEIIDMVRTDDNGKWDAEKAAHDIRMDEDGRLIINGGSDSQHLRLSDFALTQLCGKLELPSRYIKRLPPPLQAQCINYDLDNAASDGRAFMVRCKGEMARAFLSDKYSRVNNIEFLEIFEKLSHGIQHQIRSFNLNETGMWMKILIDDLRAWDPSDVSSELKVGLVIGNSEVGCRSVTVEPFVYRKACTNDAVIQHEAVLDIRHIHLKHHELQTRIAEAMSITLKKGDEALNAFIQAYHEPIDDPAAVIKRLAEKRCLSAEQTDHIQLAYQVEPLPNTFGVVNAFTRVAQALESDDRIEMERFAGSLLFKSEATRLAA
jgi:hypothetical protein